ncbi:hypothetical protein [Spirosoma montaniterrae]|uniref:Uncharacterized protein n=1 Tax=Spirosoma montaniterrae TaxID=1178516 RepID=A0A1P9WRZ7_9BACT|nr:hypothetical protein [Spirosoma montaniterrae]AQG78151.1 hypothetical protein AWR27_01565 [Spirosoma montaniterrae]
MKTLIILLLVALTTTALQAQSAQYQQAMADAIGTMKTQSEKTPTADILSVANQFERIASAEPNEWLPRYYAGLSYVFLGFMGKDATEKDKYLDNADRYLKEAQAINTNDELIVLAAYIAQARMTVDPMNRWQQYGPIFQTNIDKAKSMNPGNPRPYILEGTGLLYTPEQFGGGPATACPVLKQAAERFTTFKPVSDLHPNWGRQNMEQLLAKCSK